MPTRRHKVRTTPFPPHGENSVRSLAPPLRCKPTLLGFASGYGGRMWASAPTIAFRNFSPSRLGVTGGCGHPPLRFFAFSIPIAGDDGHTKTRHAFYGVPCCVFSWFCRRCGTGWGSALWCGGRSLKNTRCRKIRRRRRCPPRSWCSRAAAPSRGRCAGASGTR